MLTFSPLPKADSLRNLAQYPQFLFTQEFRSFVEDNDLLVLLHEEQLKKPNDKKTVYFEDNRFLLEPDKIELLNECFLSLGYFLEHEKVSGHDKWYYSYTLTWS